MSVRVMSWVWESSLSEGIDRLVLLAIADCASDSGGDAWPSVKTLTAKAMVGERTVQRAVRRLAELGELEIKANAGRNGVNVYRVIMAPRRTGTPPVSHPVTVTPRQADTPSESAPTPATVTPPPRPSDTQTVLEPSLTIPPELRSGERARKKPATELPEGWTPNPALIAEMRAEGIPDDLARRELLKFRDHWPAQPGAKSKKSDWPATWRNWLRRAVELSPNGHTAPNGIGRASLKAAGWLTVGDEPEQLRALPGRTS